MADAIVLLGCRVEANGVLSDAALRRCHAARDGFRRGLSSLVIASGGRRWGQHVEALVMRDALVELGVPSRAIWVDLCSLTTAENAVYSAELLRAGTSRTRPTAAIATCSWHLGRALANFERVGVDATGLAARDGGATLGERARRKLHEALSLRLDMATLARAGHHGQSFLPPREVGAVELSMRQIR